MLFSDQCAQIFEATAKFLFTSSIFMVGTWTIVRIIEDAVVYITTGRNFKKINELFFTFCISRY
jgi:hypothetical protein